MGSDHTRGHRPPERLGDRYLVQEEIGSGAAAITWRGWDERLERPVAIKILRQHHAEDAVFVRRFQREARAAASVSHGNVVDVYDVGQEGDVLYIVMQLIEGEDLKELIRREAPLETRRVAAIVRQVLDGLYAIHGAGIIHRDIKPQNILIGRDGVARVTDFGIAHADEDAGMTTAGMAVGTAAYMAPEQAQARPVNEATDLYAVGVILYELLTGFLPFNAPTAMAMMLEHIQSPPIPPSQRLPGRGITTAMDAVVLRALSKFPEERFGSAREMRAAVTSALRGEGGSQTTVMLPATQATRQAPLPPVREAPQRRMVAQPVPPPREEGGGLGGAVAGLLLVMLLAVAGIAAWYAWGAWDDSQGGNDPQPTSTVPAVVAPTATSEPAEPTATTAPTATTEPTEAIEEIVPVQTQAPFPTNTPNPTQPPLPTVAIPTDPPASGATEQPVLIEPIDGTPFDDPGGG